MVQTKRLTRQMKVGRRFMFGRALTALSVAAASSAATAAAAAPAEIFAIQAGRLIVDASLPARGASTVIVENGRILRIDPGATAPAGSTVVDLRTKTVLPGLIDAHVHLTGDPGHPWGAKRDTKWSEPYAAAIGIKNALITARAGFTTVRDLDGPINAVLAMRDAVNDGFFPGPRMLVAGPIISAIGGHGDNVQGLAPETADAVNTATPQLGICTGAEECARTVRKIAAKGADVIKFAATAGMTEDVKIGLNPQFNDAEMKAIVDTAHALNLRVAAHSHGARATEAAARAGADSIEHGSFIDDAAIREMKAHGAYLVATLMAGGGIKSRLGKGLFSPSLEARLQRASDERGQALAKAYRAGVKIALGTDAGAVPHGANAQELGLMVSLGGMTPRDALIAATKGGADLLGLARETGTLDPGKSADLIAVDGDPQSDPAAVTHVNYVMVEGHVIPMK